MSTVIPLTWQADVDRRRARDTYIKAALRDLRAALVLSRAIRDTNRRDDQVELGLGLIMSLRFGE